jgi:hypothetical protein
VKMAGEVPQRILIHPHRGCDVGDRELVWQHPCARDAREELPPPS